MVKNYEILLHSCDTLAIFNMNFCMKSVKTFLFLALIFKFKCLFLKALHGLRHQEMLGSYEQAWPFRSSRSDCLISSLEDTRKICQFLSGILQDHPYLKPN